MPRNPEKTRCHVPGCRAWAVRGHTRCRAHRDAGLGRRGHHLAPAELLHLARCIHHQPHELAPYVSLVLQSLYEHTGRDPVAALLAFQRLLDQLIPLLANQELIAELDALLQGLSPPHRDQVRALLQRFVSRSRASTR